MTHTIKNDLNSKKHNFALEPQKRKYNTFSIKTLQADIKRKSSFYCTIHKFILSLT